MSLATWKEEFYSTPASEVDKSDEAALIAHSLRKWRGLTKENLEKHDVHFDDCHIIESDYEEIFAVDSGSCSLCHAYYAKTEVESVCEQCPLYKISGSRCDRLKESPYNVFVDTGNPQPMIALLELAMDRLNQTKGNHESEGKG